MFRASNQVHKILVLNTKGGCGKTTLATNLASYYALRGPTPTLLDYDPNGYAVHWLDKRPADRPPIHGIAAYEQPISAPGGANLQAQPDAQVVIADLPAGIDLDELYVHTQDADSILIRTWDSAGISLQAGCITPCRSSSSVIFITCRMTVYLGRLPKSKRTARA